MGSILTSCVRSANEIVDRLQISINGGVDKIQEDASNYVNGINDENDKKNKNESDEENDRRNDKVK